MLGLILCGGQSSRMGSDKGLLLWKGQTWAEVAFHKLTSFDIPVKLSINHAQFLNYSEGWAINDLVLDDPALSVGGPLHGILSCHQNYPAEDLFVLACDMLLMETPVLQKLMDAYAKKRSPAFNAYLFDNDGKPEPLCAIYTAGALTEIAAMLSSGRLLKHSMKFALRHLQLRMVEASEHEKNCFRNFNEETDLANL